MGEQIPKRTTLWVVVAVIVIVTYAADLFTKQWALRELTDGAYRPLFGEVFGFELVFNPGAAFSFLTSATWIFTIASVVVAGVLIWLCRRLGSWPWAIVIALLLGGTLGNLTDRLLRDPGFGVGHVVDFLNYNGYFVGNVADIFIVGAALGIAILAFRGIPLSRASVGEPDVADHSEHGDEPSEASEDE